MNLKYIMVAKTWLISIPKAFKLYPDTLEELDEMIHDEKARIECQYQSSPQVKTVTLLLLYCASVSLHFTH